MRNIRFRPASAPALLLIASLPLFWFSGVSALDRLKPGVGPAADQALEWLKANQLEDGALPGFGGTPDGVYAIVAGGQDPASDAWRSGNGATPIAYLESQAGNYDCRDADRKDCNAGKAAKIALAAQMTGRDPRNFGGKDLIAGMMADTGSTGVTVSNFSQGYALIALAGAKEGVPAGTVSRVVGSQRPDGGWGWAPGAESDTNSTALMIQALVAVRPGAGAQQALIDSAIERALGYLASQQKSDAGFAYDSSFAGEPVSTSAVILGIRAAGKDPKSAPWTKDESGGIRDPLDALLGFQTPDGSFAYPGSSGDPGSTTAAVPALHEKSLVCLVGLGSCPDLEGASGQAPSPEPADTDDSDPAPSPAPSPHPWTAEPSASEPAPAAGAVPAGTVQGPPSLLSLQPARGPVTGGFRVTIAGTNLPAVRLVHFGPIELPCPSPSCVQTGAGGIEVIAPPAKAPGAVPVWATGEAGRSNEVTFEYEARALGASTEGDEESTAVVNAGPVHPSPVGGLPGGGGFTAPGSGAPAADTSFFTLHGPVGESGAGMPAIIQAENEGSARPEYGYNFVGGTYGAGGASVMFIAGVSGLALTATRAVFSRDRHGPNLRAAPNLG